MLWQNLQLQVLPWRFWKPHIQQKAAGGADLHWVWDETKGANELWKMRHSIWQVHMSNLQSLRWRWQVAVSLWVMWDLSSGRKGSLLPLWGLQYVFADAAEDRRPSMCGECQPIELCCLSRWHSSQQDSLPYSFLWTFVAPNVLRAALGLRLLRVSNLPAIYARYETALELSWQWNSSDANAEGVRGLLCRHSLQGLSWGELSSCTTSHWALSELRLFYFRNLRWSFTLSAWSVRTQLAVATTRLEPKNAQHTAKKLQDLLTRTTTTTTPLQAQQSITTTLLDAESMNFIFTFPDRKFCIWYLLIVIEALLVSP